MLVTGTGAAFAEDTVPGSDQTVAPAPAPVEEPPAAPVEEPVGEAPAPAPVEEPVEEAPAPSTPVETPAEPEAPAEEPAGEVAQTPAAPAAEAPVEATLADAILSKAFAALAVAEAAVVVPCLAPGLPLPADIVGGFEIEGDTCEESALDWDTADLYVADGINEAGYVEDGLGDTSTYAVGKEGLDPFTWSPGDTAPNGKTDIGDFWAYAQVSGGDVYSFFAITNASDTGGTSQYDLEYNRKSYVTKNGILVPDRTPRTNTVNGDLLFRFSSKGSDPIDFTDAKEWTLESDDAWTLVDNPGTPDVEEDCELVTDDAGWCTIGIPAGAFAQQTNTDGTFFEGAINISVLIGEGNCTGNFGAVQVRSVTGGSFYDSELKDYVEPLGVKTPSTCGSIFIEKYDEEENLLPGATFQVSPNPDPELADDVDYFITDNDDKDLNPADGLIEINPVDPDQEYSVTETEAPDGYLLPTEDTQGPKLVTEGGSALFQFVDPKEWEALTVEKTTEETYTAEYFWSIIKEISATGEAPWSSTTTEESPLINTVPADADPTLLPFFYRVTVTEGDRVPSDYGVNGTISVTNPNDEVVEADITDSLPGADCLVEGEETLTVEVPATGPDNPDGITDYSYVCEFDGIPEDLEGDNTVTVTWDRSTYPQEDGHQEEDPNNPTYSDSDVEPYAFGEETTSINKTVTVTDDQHVFDPAWVIEWSAEGDENTSDVYEIEHSAPAGECAEPLPNTATLTGDDDVLGSWTAYGQLCTTLPTLTLAKVVFNIDGDAVPADFDLTATPVEIEGQEAVTGNGDPTDEGGVASVPVRAGDYDLSESGLEGYSQVGDWDCGDAVVVDGDTVTVGYGTDIVCTVTNGEDVVVPPTVVEPPKVLPETGGPNQGFLLGGLAMLLAGLGMTLLGRRKSQG